MLYWMSQDEFWLVKHPKRATTSKKASQSLFGVVFFVIPEIVLATPEYRRGELKNDYVLLSHCENARLRKIVTLCKLGRLN